MISVEILSPRLAEVTTRRWFRIQRVRFAVFSNGWWTWDDTKRLIDDGAVIAAIERAHWRALATAPP